MVILPAACKPFKPTVFGPQCLTSTVCVYVGVWVDMCVCVCVCVCVSFVCVKGWISD